MINAMQVFKSMSDADKAALKQLQDEEEKRTGVRPSMRDMLVAVTPDTEG